VAEIFKAYDIRGIVPEELDEEKVYRIGRAFIRYLKVDRLVSGYDARLSSPALSSAFLAGTTAEGAQTTDIGLVGTSVLYFSLGAFQFPAGAMITASHNPPQYNGIKLLREKVMPLSSESGLPEVEALYRQIPYASPGPPRVTFRDVYPEYARHVLSFIDPTIIRPMKVVMDASNGVAGLEADATFTHLPMLTIFRLNFTPDGHFPNHGPNPELAENRNQIAAEVLRQGADLGIVWDGDGDRCYFIDNHGQFVEGYFITALLIEAILRKHPGEKVLFDPRLVWANFDQAQAFGGIPLVNRAGHSFIKTRMRQENAIFGGEMSGHYYFRENFYADNGMIPALLVLELLSRRGISLSDLLQPLRQKYHISGEINVRVSDPSKLLAEVEQTYADGRITHLDGLSVEYADWRFNLRSSQTEPLVRLNVEAKSEQRMAEMRDQLVQRMERAQTS
jgi:phosphomannomutase